MVTTTDDRVAIAVRDTGPGIAADLKPMVFEKFVRGSHRDAVRGTGLGLAMVRHIVHAHAGTIDLETAVGRGSTFTLSLPTAAAGSLPGAR